jgi:hypothetical protein
MKEGVAEKASEPCLPTGKGRGKEKTRTLEEPDPKVAAPRYL